MIRSHMVATMEEGLANHLEMDEPEIFNLLYYGMKRVRYAAAEPYQYSALQSAASSLSERAYPELSRRERRLLEDRGQGLFVARYAGIETGWRADWLAAEAKILQTLAQAA